MADASQDIQYRHFLQSCGVLSETGALQGQPTVYSEGNREFEANDRPSVTFAHSSRRVLVPAV